MSETLFTPILWLCLHLSWLFCTSVLFGKYVKYFDFDLPHDVHGNPDVIKHLFSLNKLPRAFKCRLNFVDRSSSFLDKGGGAVKWPHVVGRAKEIPPEIR